MVGHTAHGNWLAGRMASRCQRDVEQARGLAGIVEKQFVKVTHAIEHKGVGVIGLDAQVLLHHRGVLNSGRLVNPGFVTASYSALTIRLRPSCLA